MPERNIKEDSIGERYNARTNIIANDIIEFVVSNGLVINDPQTSELIIINPKDGNTEALAILYSTLTNPSLNYKAKTEAIVKFIREHRDLVKEIESLNSIMEMLK